MNRYKTKKVKLGWIGLFQTSLNWRNFIILHWKFIHTKMHPATEFGFSLFGFVIPIIDRHRSLLSFNFYTWDEKPAAYLTISILYLPSIDFRLGNGKTWFWIRNENMYAYRCMRNNRKAFNKL